MNKLYIILPLAAVFCAAAVIFFFTYIPTEKLEFSENGDGLLNPARGFYVQFDTARTAKMSTLRESGVTLALLTFDLRDFTGRDISEEKLAELRAALLIARQNGLMVIFRVAYCFSSREEYKDPSGLALIKRHIVQIAPVLNEYSDIILCVQAGFLGPWGEWHSSGLLTGDEALDALLRNEILESLLTVLDEKITVDVRRPRFARDAIAAGLDGARLGVHNDALLSTADDMGTYDDPEFTREEELLWISENLPCGVNGGEMPKVGEYSACDNALRELAALRLTYLNSRYNTEVLDTWNAGTLNGQNALSYIGARLGYRFLLKNAKLPVRFSAEDTIKIRFTLKNAGFAAISRSCTTEVIIKCGGGVYTYPVGGVDFKALGPDAESIIETRVKLPGELSGNTVEIGLKIKLEGGCKEVFACIELANGDMIYKDGVNYFAVYNEKDGKYDLDK